MPPRISLAAADARAPVEKMYMEANELHPSLTLLFSLFAEDVQARLFPLTEYKCCRRRLCFLPLGAFFNARGFLRSLI